MSTLTSEAVPSSIVPSPLTAYISATCSTSSLTHAPHLHHLAAQVLHNLQWQHEWHDLELHSYSQSLSTPSSTTAATDPSSPPSLLPRPLISGIPPRRVYTHPDMQLELIKKGIKEEDWPEERVWVCPSHLREKWSLRRFAEVFDGLPEVVDVGKNGGAVWEEMRERGVDFGRWREVKRCLLATVDDDSTVVYYVVHDGIVKPRQN